MPLPDHPSGCRQRTAIQEMPAEPSRCGLCVSMCYEENFSSLSHSFSVISVSFPLANYLIVFILELYNTLNQNAILFLKFLYIFFYFFCFVSPRVVSVLYKLSLLHTKKEFFQQTLSELFSFFETNQLVFSTLFVYFL